MLYNATDGDNWKGNRQDSLENNNGWLIAPVKDWDGITQGIGEVNSIVLFFFAFLCALCPIRVHIADVVFIL